MANELARVFAVIVKKMRWARLILLMISVRPSVRFIFIFSLSHAQAQYEGDGCVTSVAWPHLGVRVYGGRQEYHLFPLYLRHRQLVAGIFFKFP